MSNDKSSENEANDKRLNDENQASRYKRMIYVIPIVVLGVLFMTAILRWISVWF